MARKASIEKNNKRIITTQRIKILKNKTKGFNDIVFYGFHFFKQIFNYSVWQWQGDHYMWQQSFEAPFPHENEELWKEYWRE